MTENKKQWTTPQLVRHGSVKEITKQMKRRTWGNGEDVIPLLEDGS